LSDIHLQEKVELESLIMRKMPFLQMIKFSWINITFKLMFNKPLYL
jgi:hypothetical protein